MHFDVYFLYMNAFMLFHQNHFCAYDFYSLILTIFTLLIKIELLTEMRERIEDKKYQSNHKVTAFNLGALETISGPEAGC
jgi:hypothetical protein